jgi:hypothetical protein
VIKTTAAPAQTLPDSGAGDNEYVIAYDGGKRSYRRLFAWQRPEHANCRQEFVSVIAVKADGTNLALCQHCNLLQPVTQAVAKRSRSGGDG